MKRTIALLAAASLLALAGAATPAHADTVNPGDGDPNTCGDGYVVSQKYTPYGVLQLKWSNNCQANWGRFQFSNGRTYTTMRLYLYSKVNPLRNTTETWSSSPVNYIWTDYLHAGYYETMCTNFSFVADNGQWTPTEEVCA